MNIRKISGNLRGDRQRGFVLALTLVLLMIITLVATTTMIVERTQMKVGGNFSKVIKSFEVGQSGVMRAEEILKAWITTHADFDGILTYSASNNNYLYSSGDSGTALNGVAFGGGYYTVTVANNDGDIAGAGSATNDTDRKIKVNVRAYDNDGRSMTITTIEEALTSVSMPTLVAPTGFCGSGVDVNYAAGSINSGNDWAPPGATCYATSCAGVEDTNPANAIGAMAQESSSNNITNASTMSGNPATMSTDSTMQCTEWANLATQLNSIANRYVRVDARSNITVGTAAAPIVTLAAPPSGTLTLTGTNYGAGVLIVVGNLVIPAGSKLSYQGIILVVGDNSSVNFSGNVDNFGSIQFISSTPDGAVEGTFGANASQKYSSTAMQTALNSIVGVTGFGSLHRVFWAENY